MTKLVSPQNDWRNAIDLEEQTPRQVVEFLAKQHGWVLREQDGKIYAGPHDRSLTAKKPELSEEIRLKVPYFSQLDSKIEGQWWRSCFSSSVAMLAKFLKPNALSESLNADDEHLKRVLQNGDTTDPNAQIKALAHYGIKATRPTNLGWTDIDAYLRRGIPVPIGILINGPDTAPTGGGHWIIVIGKTKTGYLVHDPYGELDLKNGGYLHSDGRARLYTKERLGRRWMVDGPSTGWGVLVV